eukprot:1857599-Prymnesium_polylepis.1
MGARGSPPHSPGLRRGSGTSSKARGRSKPALVAGPPAQRCSVTRCISFLNSSNVIVLSLFVSA